MTLRIVPLYPELLSIYADRGNVRVLQQRARWRGISVEVTPLALGEALDPAQTDVVLIGGGQDRDQALVAEALVAQTPALRSAIADGVPILAVCGGYQLLGHRYVDQSGRDTPGTGLIDFESHAGPTRIVGNVVVETEFDGTRHELVGFENHAGRTLLGPTVAPLGRVIIGGGNDGTGTTEGCLDGRVVGTYVHGPLLPKNPWLADQLLAWACEHRGLSTTLAPLDDQLECAAALAASALARSERR
ncbi:MAG: glutamine amidotransferase [Thermoleophilia bacterium]|nr:glutamine amidotransferase [Thermoleophilia bacterium]